LKNLFVFFIMMSTIFTAQLDAMITDPSDCMTIELSEHIKSDDLKGVVFLLQILVDGCEKQQAQEILKRAYFLAEKNIFQVNHNRSSLLHVAIIYQCPKVAELLLSAAETEALDLIFVQNDEGATALLYAIQQGYLDVFNRMMDIVGAYASKLLRLGSAGNYTPLLMAALNLRMEMIERIIKIDPTLMFASTDVGCTALDFVVHKKSLEGVKILLRAAGARARELISKNFVRYPHVPTMTYAQEQGNEVIIELLKSRIYN